MITLGKLEAHLIEKTSLKKYMKSFRQVVRFLEFEGLDSSNSYARLDATMLEFMEACWHEGDSLAMAECSLAATQTLALSLAWRRFRPPK